MSRSGVLTTHYKTAVSVESRAILANNNKRGNYLIMARIYSFLSDVRALSPAESFTHQTEIYITSSRVISYMDSIRRVKNLSNGYILVYYDEAAGKFIIHSSGNTTWDEQEKKDIVRTLKQAVARNLERMEAGAMHVIRITESPAIIASHSIVLLNFDEMCYETRVQVEKILLIARAFLAEIEIEFATFATFRQSCTCAVL